MTINNGVDEQGRVIFIDIGELTFSKKHVEKAIEKKRWESSWSFNHDMDKKIKDYYRKRMKEEITLRNLNKYWNTG